LRWARYTVVYDALSESQDEGVLTTLAGNLSRRFGVTTMAALSTTTTS
jgi:hypothetical protein